MVLNKALPKWLADPAATRLARAVTSKEDSAIGLVRALPEAERNSLAASEDQLVRLVQDLGRNYLRYQVVASRESEEADALRRDVEVAVSVPFFAEDISDLAGLVRVGQWLWNPPTK